jgi:hypothetical protein
VAEVSTKNQVIAKFQYYYPQCDSTKAGSLFDDAYAEAAQTLQFRNGEQIITLVAGQREYDFDNKTFRIEECYYEDSSNIGSFFILNPTSLDELAVTYSGFRNVSPNNIPNLYYIGTAENGNSSKTVIGFYPAPAQTSSGGYPRIRLYGTNMVALSGSDNLPTVLLNDKYFMYKMCKDWSVIVNDGRWQEWQVHETREWIANQDHINNRQITKPAFKSIPYSAINNSRRV